MSFVYAILHLSENMGIPPVLHERTGTVVKQLVWFRVVRCPGVVMPLLCVCGSLGARTHISPMRVQILTLAASGPQTNCQYKSDDERIAGGHTQLEQNH